MTQFVCLSGMPRSGSTLLSSLLSQNPMIHAEGNSAVCQLIWDMTMSCTYNVNEQLKTNHREETMRDLIVQIPNTYYKNVPRGTKCIVDKCRSWTKSSNVELLQKYIDPTIKIIVMERSVTAVVESFYKLFKKNNWCDEIIHRCLNEMLEPGTEPIMNSLYGIKMAHNANANANAKFLFIHYDELVDHPEETIKRIYTFCEWGEPFIHTFTNVVNKYPEDDNYYNIKGFHTIRSMVKREINKYTLPSDILARCKEIEQEFLQ
jgi:sulfotransferase